VIGHEMGHGVTAATSNLTYSRRVGRLNESSSDIGGEAVEAYARAGGTGDTIPEHRQRLGDGQGDQQERHAAALDVQAEQGRQQPGRLEQLAEALDVHYSSGPNNRMFYFLSQGSKLDKPATTTANT
jgi:Zn-dependent metalloprotease